MPVEPGRDLRSLQASARGRESENAALLQQQADKRALAEENVKLASQVGEYEKHAQAEEIVSEMDRKGLSDPDANFKDKVAALIESDKDLNLVKEALSLAAGDFSFAAVSDVETDSDDHAFEDFILSVSS